MVLESLVAGLLNTYLGKYIEDLDTTNLGISLFGGDVELTDLQLRPEALYELELPLEVKAGYVEKLSVNIPWTSLYTSPVKASLEGVYIVAGPVTDRKYDAKREKRLLDAVKRKKLQELDTPQNSPTQPDDEEEKRKEQTFTEKLTATILNNLQLTIMKIHIRYEDRVSNPSSPFALGVTLRSFSGQSVNSSWEPFLVDSRATQMFKLIKLEDLAVYWNTGCKKLVCDYLTTDLWKDLMEECLDTCRIMKQDLDFVVRPISAVTKIAFDKSQMIDLDRPRLWTDLAVQEIMVSLSRQQFKSIVCLVESFKLMAVNRLYRKYHPNLHVKGNAKAWWHYAYNATVHEHIRPYSWENIKAYRLKFKRYLVLYKEKLEETEDVAAISGVLEELESDLNLTSILVARQQAKLQFVKKEEVKPKKTKPTGGGGWFWGWFSESVEEEEVEERESDFLSKLTEEEKKNLYEGIGYSEDDILPDKPKEYVENRFNFSLKSCCFKLRNHGMDLVNSKLEEVFAMFEQRPSAEAFRFSLSTENLMAEGVKQDDNSATIIVKPDIVYKGPDEKLFSAEVEMNPLYTTADSAIRVAVQPVKILYDAVTVAETVYFFSMSSSSFEELKNAANRQLAKLAKVGRLSVQHAIEKHKTLNVNINLKAPYIIIPEGGSFSSDSRLLMADLGSLQINSDLQPDDVVLQGATMSELVQRLYDRFNIDISNIQLLFLKPGVDIEEARQEEDSPHHILPKMGLQLSLYNSINPQYRAQPQQKMEALLPSLKLNISETNIFALLQFLNTFPSLAESVLNVDEVDSTEVTSSAHVMDYREVVSDETVKQLRAIRRALNQGPVDEENIVKVTEESVEAVEVGAAPQPPILEASAPEKFFSASEHSDEDITIWSRSKSLREPNIDDTTSESNLVNSLVKLTVREVVISVSKAKDGVEEPYLMLRLDGMCTEMAMTTYGLSVQAGLTELQLVDKLHRGKKGQYTHLLSSVSNKKLINMLYKKVDPSCPEFRSRFGSTEQSVEVEFSTLTIVMHKESFLDLKDFSNKFLSSLSPGTEDREKEPKIKTEEEEELSTKKKTATFAEEETEPAKEDSSTVLLPANVVRMNVAARLGNLGILLCDNYHTLAQINIKGLESNIIQMRTKTIVRARLEDLLVQDSAQSTLYPRILCIEDEDVFSIKFVAYNQAAEATPSLGVLDYHCKLRLGRLQLVYLPKFVNNVTDFFSPFSAPAVATQAVDTAQTLLQQQVKDVEDRGHRVGLHIDIQAPVVILPETSNSPDALLARLGDLSIRNSFVQEEKVPVDKIVVNLSSMQVSRAKFGDQQTLSAQRLLLEPVGLHVEVCRLLRVGNSSLPQISISGKLENFKIHLGQPDLKTIFAILSGEEESEGIVEVDTPEQQQEEVDPESINDNPQQSGNQEVQPETAQSPIIRTKLTLKFDMDGMDLILYKTNNAESIFYSLDQDGFSHFQLHGISADVETRDDNTIEACFFLQMVMLDDIRPKSPLAVKKMIYHYNKQGASNDTIEQMQSENDSAADKENGNIPPVVLTTLDVVDAASALKLHKPLVKMTYKQDKDSQDIDLTLEGLRINLCIPYLLAVAEFFAVSNASQEGDSGEGANPADGRTESPPPVASPPPTPTTQTAQPGRTFKAVGRLSKPEIVLFAYPSSKESRILVLRTEIDFNYEKNSLQDSFSAAVNQLEVFSSLYSSLILPEGSCSVLRPCNIKFERTVSPSDNKETLSAEFGDINVHISPTVLHIVMAVLRSWNSDQVLADADEPMKKEPLTDLWSPKAVLPSKFRRKRKTETGHGGATVKNKTPPQTFVIDMDNILFVLELEVGETYMPSLCVKSGVEAIMSDWSSQMRMKADVHLEATFHNEKLGVWEPLIEPIMEKNGTYRPWDICFKMVNAPSRHLCPTMYDCEDFGNMKPVDTVVRTAMYRDDSDESETSPDDTDSFGDRASLLARRQRSFNRDQVDSGRGVAKPVKHVSMETGPAHKSDADGGDDDEEEGFWDTIENALLFSSSSESEGEDDDGKALIPKFAPPVSDSDSGEEADNESVTSKSIDEVDAPTRDEEEEKMATYLVLDSADLLQITLTPEAIGAIKDIAEAFSAGPSKPFKTGKPEFPSVEIENKLGFHLTVHVHPDLQIEEVKSETITILHEERKSPEGEEEEEDTVDCFKNPFKARDPPQATPPDPTMESLGFLATPGDRQQLPFGPPQPHVLKPSHSSSKLASAFANVGNLALLSGAFVYNVGLQKNQPVKTKDHIKLEVPGFDPLQISCRRAGSFIHQLTPSKKKAYSVVCDVEINHGRRRITLRSPLQVSNQLQVSMVMTCDLSLLPDGEEGCYETDDNKRALLGNVSPGQTCPVPLFAAYQAALEIRPEGTDYVGPEESLKWQDVASNKGVQTVACQPEEAGAAIFFYNVTWEASPVRRLVQRNVNVNAAPYGTLCLHSPVVLHNYLPYEVSYTIGDRPEVPLSAGVSVPSCSLDMEKNHRVDIHLRGYQGLDWSGKFYISLDMDEYEMVVMETTSLKGEKKQMALGVHTTVGGSRDVFLYAPYWLVNKTALPVEFRGAGSSTVYKGNTTNDPALFSFHRHRRKKAKMRMFRSKWSSAIPLDTVGHAGVVTCRDKDSGKVYQVWLEIQLSKLKLTKMVTLLPFFMVVNKTAAEVTFTEEGQEDEYWTVIQPEEVLPLWPHSGVLNLVVRQPGVENKGAEIPVLSQYFPIHKSHTTVLRMWNGTALTVNVAGGTESPTTITFTPFQPGDAPVRVVNCCHNAFIRFHQKGMSQVIVLTPNQSVLYTWDDPAEERTLWWNLYKRDKPSFPARINQDNAGIETVILPGSETSHGGKKNGPGRSKQKRTNIHWVSYLDGLQRVLFFTEDASLAQDVREASGEKTSLEAFLSLEGLGVSLVSSLYTEIAYLSITSTPPLWEVNSKGDSWKMLKLEVATFLEDQFRHGHPEAVIPDKVRADFQTMRMVKPTPGGLRRTYQPGLWFQYRSSDHHTGMHAKLQRLQLDNQLQTAVFPTVLYPAPLPRKVLKKMGPRPFIELALMRRQVPEQHSDTIKYCKLLLQQFSVRLDKGFLLTVADFFTTHMEEEEESAKLQSDYGKINLTLRDTVAALATSGTDKIYLEYFHFSPIKIFISFSLSGEPHLTQEQKDTITNDVVDFFLGTVGTTLTSLKDVEMKLAFFERRGVMLTQSQLIQEVQSHYTGQAIQQSYVLLLGLDVIGNPYGLVTKIGKGLGDLFYEPYQGAIEGPEQFAEGVARGVQSLLGHAVGGTAGALSSITGSVGKAFSLLSMDEDYSTRRRQRMQQQPSDMPSSLLLAGQSFIMGIVMGISGVVLQPVKGAQQEGVEGFFKGIGKGLLGLFSRPVAGVFDMVSMSFDAVRRSAEVGNIVVHRQRVPRFINPESGLTPYSAYQAVGNTLLLNIERGKYAETDMYVAHAAVNTEQDEQMLLITDQRILLVDKCYWFSGWDVEWVVPLDRIVGVPTSADGKLSFQHKEEEESTNLFTATDKEVDVKDQQVLKWLYSHLDQALDDVRGT
ncbi:VPS13A [Branchiostoma lanceolatum]|uniref:VPS13A protein n=1 Tax=Branchiostoma lanceolatum TaxID=7740 RepID=A0A8K0AJ58_BRALA|nr:VPS13A [Branchiostoma lanceolatum]